MCFKKIKVTKQHASVGICATLRKYTFCVTCQINSALIQMEYSI